MPLSVPLTMRERQIMDIVYIRGSVTAADVRADLPDARSGSTVRTQLRVLERKGHLCHEENGLRYVYRAVIPPDAARTAALQHVLHTFFEGSVAQLLRAILADVRESMSEERRARLGVAFDHIERECGTPVRRDQGQLAQRRA